MKNLIKVTFLIIVFLLSSIILRAQNDSLRVFDLVVSVDVAKINPAAGDTSQYNPSTDTLILSASFKINKPDSLSEIYISVGTNPNQGQIINQTLTKLFHNGVNCLHSNSGEVCTFMKRGTSYSIRITRQDLQIAEWLTISAKHINGSISAKKYFKFR